MSKRIKWAEHFKKWGIEYKNNKINSPLGWICKPLKKGNGKLGETVWSWSILPGTGFYDVEINGREYHIKGTCICDCKDCYAKTGHYVRGTVRRSLAINTILANDYLPFLRKVLCAMLEAIEEASEGDEAGELRVHVAGDFMTTNEFAYMAMWQNIMHLYPGIRAWTYTKIEEAQSVFDDCENANVVRSVIPGCGVNYGPCGYVMKTYKKLKASGASVAVCPCGVDDTRHCAGCTGCSNHTYTLFLLHSTNDYDAKKDPDFPEFCDFVKAYGC
jgi:hypothetical protein